MLIVMLEANKRVAFIYLRVSTARQASEGVGLDAQEAKCRAHVERMGWTVGEVLRDEGISGKDGVEHRAGLAKLIKHCAKTPNAVAVVYSVSRLARRQRLLWQLLDERDGFGLEISSATEQFDTTTPMGKAMFGMIGIFAQLEADMIGERTKDALAEVKAQGKQLGNPGIKALAPEAVELIKELRANGASQRAIIDELERRNIPTPRGKQGRWRLESVQQALKA